MTSMVTVLIPLVSVLVSASVAVLVPYLTFAHNRKLEQIRLLATHRADLYVDALAEAHAEKTWLEHTAHARSRPGRQVPRSAGHSHARR